MTFKPTWRLSEPPKYKMYPWGDTVFLWKKKTMKKDKRKLLVWPWANNLIYFKRSQTWITLTLSFFCLFPGHWTLLREDRELFSLSTHKFLQSNFRRAFCIQQFCNHNQVCSSSWLVQNFPFFTLPSPPPPSMFSVVPCPNFCGLHFPYVSIISPASFPCCWVPTLFMISNTQIYSVTLKQNIIKQKSSTDSVHLLSTVDFLWTTKFFQVISAW